MTISVDYSQFPYLITFPKSDLTFVSGTEYKITVEQYWVLLRDYADSEEAMSFPIIYTNIPPTSSTPRIVEINENYYVAQFEETSPLYSVEIISGNTNFRTVEVKNQISVGTNNTTGFIDPQFLEYGLFSGTVAVDVVNGVSGTTKTASGEIIGTRRAPSNNMPDAKTIAQTQGLIEFSVIGDITLDVDAQTPSYLYKGQNAQNSVITVEAAADVTTCEFWYCTLAGILDGGAIVRDSIIASLNYVNGIIFQTMLIPGTIQIDGSNPAYFLDCYAGAASGLNLDMNGAHTAFFLGFRGPITIKNATSGAALVADSGSITIDNTNTDLVVYSYGTTHLEDEGTNSTMYQDSMHEAVQFLQESLKGEKALALAGNTWYLRIWDTNSPRSLILDKALKDSSGNEIDDLAAGALAKELESTV